ncbi:unnamed protein product [Cylindrotheca closterium]|uniref:Uncharacterized protein n=1 Tax=Cylindrotheca closterium TaxID=2856 RepID=A0AAD2G1R2_9STRA|nr:unnamed protein product [Cylindrotheca closterium]
MEGSMDRSDFNPAPVAKRRRLDQNIAHGDDERKVSSTTSGHSSRLVVNTVLKQIATADKLLLVNLFMENLENFLQDENGKIMASNDPKGLQFVDTFLALDGCDVILHTLKQWVEAGARQNNTIDEDTASFVSTALGFLVHLMVFNRRTAFRILEVKGVHITPILMQICRGAQFDTVILARAISIWGKLMTNVTRREDVLVENFSNLILNSMHLHPECERIQRYGCKFFASLASMGHNNGETQNFDRQKLRLVVEQALLSYRHKERTYYWCRQCTAFYSAGQLVRHDDGSTSSSTDSSRSSSRTSSRTSSDTLSQNPSQISAARQLARRREDGEVTDSSRNSSRGSSADKLDGDDDGNTSSSTDSSRNSSRASSDTMSSRNSSSAQLVRGVQVTANSSQNSSTGPVVSADGGNTSSGTDSSNNSSARKLGSSDDGNTSSSTDSSRNFSARKGARGGEGNSSESSSADALARGDSGGDSGNTSTDSSHHSAQKSSAGNLARDDDGNTSASTDSSQKLSADNLNQLEQMARDDDRNSRDDDGNSSSSTDSSQKLSSDQLDQLDQMNRDDYGNTSTDTD